MSRSVLDRLVLGAYSSSGTPSRRRNATAAHPERRTCILKADILG